MLLKSFPVSNLWDSSRKTSLTWTFVELSLICNSCPWSFSHTAVREQKSLQNIHSSIHRNGIPRNFFLSFRTKDPFRTHLQGKSEVGPRTPELLLAPISARHRLGVEVSSSTLPKSVRSKVRTFSPQRKTCSAVLHTFFFSSSFFCFQAAVLTQSRLLWVKNSSRWS